MTNAATKTTKRKKATGPKYQARWQAQKRLEANMSDEEKAYKQRLNGLLSTLETFRYKMPTLTLREASEALGTIIAEARINPAPPRPAAETPEAAE